MSDRSPLIHPFLHEDNKKTRRWARGAVLFFLLAGGAGLFFWRFWPLEASRPSTFSHLLETTRELKNTVSLVPAFLGYDRPKTYLVLFLNNAEMRPGGGFIGSYALVKIDQRKLLSFETSGSENLDWQAPADFKIEPPQPIKEYLRQPNWYFRDANWSPDFSQSARQALWFYRFEGGRDGSKIDGVIGVTATVLEELLKITGPLTVNGRLYEADNVIEELQYQVEIGYQEEGKKRSERKALVGDLGRALLARLNGLSARQWKELYELSQQMFREKQMMIYSPDEGMEALLLRQGWGGEMKAANGDYLMVADANLISFKSDPEVKRKIVYEIKPEGGRLRAKVAVVYEHRGETSWRVTRYRTYTRFYLPLGSEFIASDGFVETDRVAKGESPVARPAVIGQELGKTVLAGFFFVNPGESRTLTVEYYLPPAVQEQINRGLYTLFVQKQLGTLAHQLTLDLNFGKKIGLDGASVFRQETDLRVDREFEVEF